MAHSTFSDTQSRICVSNLGAFPAVRGTRPVSHAVILEGNPAQAWSGDGDWGSPAERIMGMDSGKTLRVWTYTFISTDGEGCQLPGSGGEGMASRVRA